MALLDNLKAIAFPLAILCNTIIGIGIFSLPYLMSQVGILVMLIYIICLGVIVTLINIMFAEIVLKTPDYKRMPGFARIYLGKWGEMAALVIMIAGIASALVAFIIIGGQFLQHLLGSIFGSNPDTYVFIYFLAGALCVFLGTEMVTKVSMVGLLLFLATLVTLSTKGIAYFRTENLPIYAPPPIDFLLPYGPIIFAMWGASSIPEVEEWLGRNKRKDLLKKVIALAALISLFVYIIFCVLILGITGANTTESAFVGLSEIFPSNLLRLCFFFGLITSFTSFIILGLTLRKILSYDLYINKHVASFITTFAPLTLYFFGIKSFLGVFSFVGGILLGLDGILIILMYQKIRPNLNYLTFPLIFLFLTAVFFEIVHFLK